MSVKKLLVLPLLLFPLLALLSDSAASLFSTNIILTSAAPDRLMPCRPDTLFVYLSNNTTEVLTDIQIHLDFEEVFHYVLGSASSNVMEFNTTDVSQPVFELPQINPGFTAQISILLEIPCTDFEEVFGVAYEYELYALHGNDPPVVGITNTMVTDVPFLIMNPSQVTNNPYVGNLGDSFDRQLEVLNSSLGELDSFKLIVNHEEGLWLTAVSPGTLLHQDSVGYTLLLSASDFSNIGNSNETLDYNEIITITETLSALSCLNSESIYTFELACGGAVCQTDHVTATTNIIEDLIEPAFTVIEDISIADCYCGDTPVRQELTFINTGNDIAKTFSLIFRETTGPNPYGDLLGIDSLSIEVSRNGVPDSFEMVGYSPISQEMLETCFEGSEHFLRYSSIRMSNVEIGDTIIVAFDLYFCKNSECQDIYQTGFQYRYGYRETCPDITIWSDYFKKEAFGTTSLLELNNVMVEPGDELNFHYELASPLLEREEGWLRLVIEMNGGVNWIDNNAFAMIDADGLATVLPDSIVFIPLDTIGPSVDSTLSYIELYYELPFFNSAILDFQLFANCLPFWVFQASSVTVHSSIFLTTGCPLDDYSCGVGSCSETKGFLLFCPSPEVTDGPEVVNYFIGRDPSSWGLPDNDQNQLADGVGVLDLDSIRLDRAITGDTLLEVVTMKVYDTEPVHFYEEAYVYSTLANPLVSDTPLLETGGIGRHRSELKIFDVSQGQIYVCDDIPYTAENFEGTGDTLLFRYDISLANLAGTCSVPPDFVYAAGDSMILTNKYVVNKSRFDPLGAEKINAFPITSFIDYNNDDTLTNNGGAYLRNLELTGFKLNTCIDKPYIFSCETKLAKAATLNLVISNEDDFFRSEFRSFGRWEDFGIKAVDFFDPEDQTYLFEEAIVTVYDINTNRDTTCGLNNNNNTGSFAIHNGFVNFVLDNDYLTLDLEGFMANNTGIPIQADEGYTVVVRVTSNRICNENLEQEHSIESTFNFDDEKPGQLLSYNSDLLANVQDQEYDFRKNETVPLSSLADNIVITNPNPNLIGYEENLEWPLNIDIAGNSNFPNQSMYLLMKAEPIAGEFADIQATYNGQANNLLPGIWHQQEIPLNFSLSHDFLITAVNNSCQEGTAVLGLIFL